MGLHNMSEKDQIEEYKLPVLVDSDLEYGKGKNKPSRLLKKIIPLPFQKLQLLSGVLVHPNDFQVIPIKEFR
jgi:hypothetical protein